MMSRKMSHTVDTNLNLSTTFVSKQKGECIYCTNHDVNLQENQKNVRTNIRKYVGNQTGDSFVTVSGLQLEKLFH